MHSTAVVLAGMSSSLIFYAPANNVLTALSLQFYRDYDRALNTYMSVDTGIGMDLTLVSIVPAVGAQQGIW